MIYEAELEKIYTDLFKLLTGNHKVKERNLNENFLATAMPLVASNHLPEVADNSDGFWRRPKVIECLAKFVDSPGPPSARERKLDDSMAENSLPCADTFLALLVKYHRGRYLVEGLTRYQPESVCKATKAWRYSQDPPQQFVDLTCNPGVDAYVTSDALLVAFKE
ncbi:uncharacterized protein EV422DRAFT_533360 [Fimicolochytrium jonesii]|uniref:uncharacterized protein n=1 Tax=Fimicolochytrium jonesii TaxID=1396493 RepID=UPI0022FE2A53|nr:uncharacterized protein EV422DRAFT_533360 [Fimicolochytrium jonesii]KAI8820032.1 hypothetical protein EV422DRAFT_533360 [Fimicolochytrium jonesii]